MKTADEWFKEGEALYSQGKTQEAIECMDKVIELDPKYLEAYRFKGKSLSSQGKETAVIEVYKKALEIDPNYKFAYNGMAISYKRLRQYDQAIEAYDKAISLDPNWSWPHNGKANALSDLNRLEEAIKEYDIAMKLDPTSTLPMNGKANALLDLNRQQEALDLYYQALKILPHYYLARCNLVQLLSKMGKTKEALAELKIIQENKEAALRNPDLGPGQRRFITETLGMISELDTVEAQTEEVIKQQDKQNPVVQRLVDNIRKLQQEKEQVTVKLMSNMGSQSNGDLVKELARLKEEFTEMKQELMSVKKDVKQIKSQLEDMREELNNKMDDFRKKLDSELAKSDVSLEDQKKLKDYFNAFLETFSSTHVTSQVIDSGQVQLDSDNTKATLLSVVASFTPFIGSVLSSGIKSLGDFLQSKEMKANARKMKGLASDATRLSQIIGEAAFKIVLDKEKQKRILSITNEDLKKMSGNIFEKIFKFCENLSDQIDCYLYTNLYETASARLGHNDANKLIELWLGGKIDPYGIQDEMVKKAISMKYDEKEPESPGSPEGIKSTNRSSCCNMF